MNFTSKHKGNIALAHAISYFGEKGYYLFLPVGDNGGAIDLAVSEDGTHLQRVQCKYTTSLHPSLKERFPDKDVWRVTMTKFAGHSRADGTYRQSRYTAASFDLLFVATPSGDYLIDWKEFTKEHNGVPRAISLGQRAEKYRVG